MFPKRIKELRIQAGLSQKKLAEKLFISQQSVGKWESGISKPSPETTLKLATLFGVSTDYLLGLTDDPKGQFVVALTDTDPQMDSILKKMQRLNAQGLERLEQYADDLVSSGKYEKVAVKEPAM